MDKNDPSSVKLITYCHYGVYVGVCQCVTVWLPSLNERVVWNDPVGGRVKEGGVLQGEGAELFASWAGEHREGSSKRWLEGRQCMIGQWKKWLQYHFSYPLTFWCFIKRQPQTSMCFIRIWGDGSTQRCLEMWKRKMFFKWRPSVIQSTNLTLERKKKEKKKSGWKTSHDELSLQFATNYAWDKGQMRLKWNCMDCMWSAMCGINLTLDIIVKHIDGNIMS